MFSRKWLWVTSALIAVTMVAACREKTEQVTPLTAKTEAELRRSLGIPPEAERVVIFNQNAHWDLDWLKTFDTYYNLYVEKTITEALDILDHDPKYYYSISEIAFLKRYWGDHPEDRVRIRHHAQSGRLRIVGGGISSPDTLIPAGETLVRDWLIGVTWCRENLGVTPIAAWQPDSFGHSPSLPGILAGIGYRFVGFSRVDGVDANNQWYGTAPPTPGSTADILIKTGALDFIWEGEDGSRVLAHWMLGSYCQGDGIDSLSSLFLPGQHISGRPDPEWTNARIASYLNVLKDISPTDYIFVPIGCDFATPIEGLPRYMDAWNSGVYPTTGVWAVQATFEDYMRLVEFQKDRLPVLNLDINPYYMGFYASRPLIKKEIKEVSYKLMAAEAASLIAERGGIPYPKDSLSHAWEKLSFTNHHDFCPGTSTDEVYRDEQLPWLADAEVEADSLLASSLSSVASSINTTVLSGTPIVVFNPLGFERTDIVKTDIVFPAPGNRFIKVVDPSGIEIPSQIIQSDSFPDGSLNKVAISFLAANVPPLGYAVYSLISVPSPPSYPPLSVAYYQAGMPVTLPSMADSIAIETSFLTSALSSSAGWAITSLVHEPSGTTVGTLLNDVAYYADNGGLWIFRDTFSLSSLLSLSLSSLTVSTVGPVLAHFTVTSQQGSDVIVREYTFYQSLPRVDLSITAAAPLKTSVVSVFSTTSLFGADRMAIPYGFISRPFRKLFNTVFWPVVEWADLSSSDLSAGLTLVTPGSGSVRFLEDGRMENILFRNNKIDTPVVGVGGESDPDVHTFSYSLIPHGIRDDATIHKAALMVFSPLRAVSTGIHGGALPIAFSLAWSNNPSVIVTAAKKKESGSGIILRLERLGSAPDMAWIFTSYPTSMDVYEIGGTEYNPSYLAASADAFPVVIEPRFTTIMIR